MRYLVLIMLALIPATSFSAPKGDCQGTPDLAAVELPSPLKDWAQIQCTPYGHIIEAKDQWIWTKPGGYRPVMIPAQMVRSNPAPLGNKAYFTKIAIERLTGTAAISAVAQFETGFDSSESAPSVYRLDVESALGRSLVLRFFDYGDSRWGMWCNNGCDLNSRFMILNMAEQPNKAKQEGTH